MTGPCVSSYAVTIHARPGTDTPDAPTCGLVRLEKGTTLIRFDNGVHELSIRLRGTEADRADTMHRLARTLLAMEAQLRPALAEPA